MYVQVETNLMMKHQVSVTVDARYKNIQKDFIELKFGFVNTSKQFAPQLKIKKWLKKNKNCNIK